jgi:YcaO-like protein with predicted kinase domain
MPKARARTEPDPSPKKISAALLGALAAQIGVTRVARVTGLDRGGVEVACAVRPGGHVLQVSNGKGLDAASAKAGAILEAAELWAAERPAPSQLIFATLEELQARELEAWPLEEELLAPELFSPSLRIAWLPVEILGRPQDGWHAIFLPASVIHCVPSTGPWLGPSVHRWTSNGMGAHPDGELALRHALLEAAERDGLARALPDGWTERDLKQRKLDPQTLAEAAPKTAALVEKLKANGLTAHLFDLRPFIKMNSNSKAEAQFKKSWMDGLMLAGALLIDDEEGPVPLAAGYACAAGRDTALLGALLEAAQSRLTDIHGAREDIAPADHEAMHGLAQAAGRAKAKVNADTLPEEKPLDSKQLTARFAAAGFPKIAALDLAPPDCPARIIKVVAPGLRLSGLLQ